VGMGGLTHAIIERSGRLDLALKTRSRSGNYGVHRRVRGNGQQLADLSTTKAGNKGLRSLIELAWPSGLSIQPLARRG
jgi:hypothetical protein